MVDVIFGGDRSLLGDDEKGQYECRAKSGLQCNALLPIVNSQLPNWVYWLPGEFIMEKQNCSQIRVAEYAQTKTNFEELS